MVGLGLGLVLVATLLGGTAWGRHQLALSFTREPDSYLELYLLDPSAAGACPPVTTPATAAGAAKAGTVEFVVGNHTPGEVRVPWSASFVAPPGGGVLQSGVIELAAGASTRTMLVLRPPSPSFTVQITLTGRPQRLVVTCPRPAGST